MRVLLVEDAPDLAEVTAELLSEQGLDVRTALSGHEALEIAPAFLPDVILCDLNLPDMNGAEVVRVLRSRSSTSQSYNVILTAMPEKVTHREAQGIDAVMSKPITPDTVRMLVHQLGQRRGSGLH